MAALLHPSPDRRDRHRDRHRHRRHGVAARAAGRAVPRHRAAADHRHRHLHGADAETIEQSVATPLEQQMNGVDDMLYMQSTNGNDGSMQLTVTFDIEHRPEHRSGQRAEPHGAGAAEPAHRRHAVRFHDAQVDRPADDAGVAAIRRPTPTTRCSWPTTPTSTSSTRSTACTASATSASSAPASTRCASGCSPTGWRRWR